jgi:hypothetical protein
MGDLEGNIFQVDTGVSDYNPATQGKDPIKATVTSAKWNPFVELGQKVQFGYIDFYYERNDNTSVDLFFYTDNSNTFAAKRILTFDAPTYATSYMKRVYINCMGEFIRMTIDPAQTSGFKILGMILWARPAGRITP